MLLSSLKPGLWILFWISVSILVGMLVLFSYLGMTEVKDTGGFVPLTVLGWMFDPATPGVFPITLISTLGALGSILFLKFYPGFQSTPLAVVSANVVPVAASNKSANVVTANKPANAALISNKSANAVPANKPVSATPNSIKSANAVPANKPANAAPANNANAAKTGGGRRR